MVNRMVGIRAGEPLPQFTLSVLARGVVRNMYPHSQKVVHSRTHSRRSAVQPTRLNRLGGTLLMVNMTVTACMVFFMPQYDIEDLLLSRPCDLCAHGRLVICAPVTPVRPQSRTNLAPISHQSRTALEEVVRKSGGHAAQLPAETPAASAWRERSRINGRKQAGEQVSEANTHQPRCRTANIPKPLGRSLSLPLVPP
jgi:hypothetical protein